MGVRQIRQEDFEQYILLRRKGLKDYQRLTTEKLKLSPKQIKEEFQSVISDKKRTILVVEEAEGIKAYLMGRLIKNACQRMGHIDDIFVKKNARKRGFGKLLIEEFINWLNSQKVSKISLSVRTNNKVAIQLYKKAGFSVTHYEMGKSLRTVN